MSESRRGRGGLCAARAQTKQKRLPAPSPLTIPSRRSVSARSLSHHHPSTDTFFCVDKSVTAVVIQGLAEHKEELGAPLCPCR